MVLLIQLPPEVLHNTLSFIDPEDLAAIPQTCQLLCRFVAGNNTLFRAIYLRHLDEPPNKSLDWEQELHDLARLRLICNDHDSDKSPKLPFVYKTFTRLLANSVRAGVRVSNSTTHPQSRNTETLGELFQDERNRDAFFHRSFIYERAKGLVTRLQVPPKEEHQMSAKLHCLYGMPELKCGRTHKSVMYPFACSKVYDLRQYSGGSRWGPFMSDGSCRVDWEKVEAVLLVLRSNIHSKGLDNFPVFANVWGTAFSGSWPGSYLPMPIHREMTPLDEEDPYGVAGTWLRVICFIDYNDFYTYNFPMTDPIPHNVPRPALQVSEATRLIMMKFQVTRIEPPGEEDGQELPVVHFRGFSRSLDGSWDENANSDLRGEINIYGSCRLTPEGEVRWTTFSIFNEESRWRSEGVQIGGLRSARGVVGNWFDKDFDPHGPAGPTAFWKISDRETPGEDQQVLYHDFLPLIDGAEAEGGADDEAEDEDEEVEEGALGIDVEVIGDREDDAGGGEHRDTNGGESDDPNDLDYDPGLGDVPPPEDFAFYHLTADVEAVDE